jgi:aspartyl-tRNA(Asn)/glutamyl-tRNA(Gln) amidotransferase subunit B
VGNGSLVDYNRAGVPLLEIVSEPEIGSPEEAGAYLRKLRAILRYLDICDGNMEEGSFRCDANVSIMPAGSETFGTRAELKNLNSFKHVEKALAYEILRQREVIEDGGKVVQETRLWNPDRAVSTSMRGKEEAHDYRYFPDPDLLPLAVDEAWVAEVRDTLPELPDERAARFVSEMELSAYDAGVMTASRELAEYFESVLETFHAPKPAANWIMVSLLGWLNAEGKTIAESPVSPQHLGELLALIEEGTISGKIAKTVFEEMAASGRPPKKIVEEKGLVQMSDESAIAEIVERIVAANPGQAEEYRGGKTKLMGFFVGQVMKETKGKANPKMVNEILKKALEG